MKIVSKIVLSMAFALLITLSFTSYVQAEAFKSMSFGGATGLISTPTAHTGWDLDGKGKDNRIGLDLGYHYVHYDKKETGAEGSVYHLPKALVHIGVAGTSLELGFTYDMQPDWPDNSKTNDMLFNAKWVFVKGLAIGGSYQRMDLNGNGYKDEKSNDKQFYIAATYEGTFFTMPAETTIVVGHTFYGKKNRIDNENKNVDLSMGFDLDLLPKYLKGYVHWINDFANYSYSTEPGGADALHRGCFNTGLRFAFLQKKYKYKLNLDVIMTDALDHNRDWAVGATFGIAL